MYVSSARLTQHYMFSFRYCLIVCIYRDRVAECVYEERESVCVCEVCNMCFSFGTRNIKKIRSARDGRVNHCVILKLWKTVVHVTSNSSHPVTIVFDCEFSRSFISVKHCTCVVVSRCVYDTLLSLKYSCHTSQAAYIQLLLHNYK